jgi:uncharacterized protein (DUF1697 family)
MVCAMPRQVALLRGINVGPGNRVGMAPLREVFTELGFSDVATYVNSGNVVFSGRRAGVAKIERAVAERFGFDVPVVLRTRDELAATVAANPLAAVASNASRYLVLFGDGEIDPARADDVACGDGEEFAVRGREAFLWLPGGVQNSKLVRAMNEQRLGVRLTGRARVSPGPGGSRPAR